MTFLLLQHKYTAKALFVSHVDRISSSANFKVIAGVFIAFYLVFIYDLLNFGPLFDTSNESNQDSELRFTHSSQTRDDGSLTTVLVLNQWTRPVSTLLRNAFLFSVLQFYKPQSNIATIYHA